MGGLLSKLPIFLKVEDEQGWHYLVLECKHNMGGGGSYGNPIMKSFGSMTCLMNLPHHIIVSL